MQKRSNIEAKTLFYHSDGSGKLAKNNNFLSF